MSLTSFSVWHTDLSATWMTGIKLDEHTFIACLQLLSLAHCTFAVAFCHPYNFRVLFVRKMLIRYKMISKSSPVPMFLSWFVIEWVWDIVEISRLQQVSQKMCVFCSEWFPIHYHFRKTPTGVLVFQYWLIPMLQVCCRQQLHTRLHQGILYLLLIIAIQF